MNFDTFCRGYIILELSGNDISIELILFLVMHLILDKKVKICIPMIKYTKCTH